jgi:hypothetical protein
LNTPLESATRDHIAAAIAENISAAVAEIAENTAGIDQAKGMLILLNGVDDQTAFDTLRRHSQNTNICDRTVYGPPLNTHCTRLDGPATVRISNVT